MRKTRLLTLLLLLMTAVTGAWAFSGGSGTQASPYLIASTTDWNNLVSNVNGGNTYSGKYFKMTANVGTVSTWMTGTFSGTFDGDGKTLTVGYSTSARYCAPFGTLGGTVKNLRVAGTLSTSAKNFGGIAAQVASGKTVTIQNCRVSATLTSTLSGDNSSGGFVGVVGSGGTLNMTGCTFTGSLQGSGATACGGFIGYKEGTCSMTDCLFAPASVTMSPTYAGTFSRPSAPTMTRCYYTRTLGTAQGLQARTIAAGDYVSLLSVTKGEATATYTVSGITVYSGGIDFNDGSTTTFYGGSGQNVSLALTAETRTGYQFSQYAASQGTLASETTDTPTLTMPAANSTANDVVTISAEYTKNTATQYSVTLAEGTEDAENWSATPSQATEGQTVTINYAGTKKVKSVKAKKKKKVVTDLSTINANYTASNGETLTGTLASNVQISIADGATVTLDGVTINGVNDANYEWAGITCLGDATIILSGTNTVKGFYEDYPGIQAAAGKTLIINGTGSLTASSYGWGAGIGGVNSVACGDIEIQGGIITATSVTNAAGIGGGDRADCGNITISGGIVNATGGSRGAGIGGGRRGPTSGSCGNILISGGTVTATGGSNAAGIGGGRGYNSGNLSSCGTITITTGVTKMIATKGDGADNSIGAGKYGTCGTVTIGGNVGAITTSPYTYQP